MSRGEVRDALWRYTPLLVFSAFIAAFFVLPGNREVNKSFYLIVLPLTLISARLDDYRAFWRNDAMRSAAAFVAYLVMTLVWSSGEAAESLTDALSVLAFLLLIVIAAIRVRLAQPVALWFAVITTTHALVVMAVWYSEHGLGERMLGIGRLDQPLQLAAVQAGAGALAAIWFMAERTAATRWLVVVPGVCALSILSTTSRGPLLALVLTIVAGALILRTRRAWLLGISVIVVAIGASSLEPMFVAVLEERGASFRPEIWTSAWDRIDDAWLLGHGLGSPSTFVIDGIEFRHFHNIVLMAWFYGGVVAVALLLLTIGAAVRRGLLDPAGWPWLAAFCAGLLCQIPNGGPPITHPHPTWLYLWLPFAMASVAATQVTTKTAPEGAV